MLNYHFPVLKKEVLNYWLGPKTLKKEKIILIDATCGEGGHSLAILEKAKKEKWLKKLTLLCFDADKEIIKRAKKRLIKFQKNIIFVNANFNNLDKKLKKLKVFKIDGILLDLGVSMYHYKFSTRGFSLMNNEPLDMRLDKKQKLTAAEIINYFSELELTNIFKFFGEEKWSKKIAQKIISEREIKKIESSQELADIISKAIPVKFHPKHIHPATRIFQALRIVVNKELDNLQKLLEMVPEIINPNGRILVISFHSLEDRLVKNYFKKLVTDKTDQIYGQVIEPAPYVLITKKPVIADVKELSENVASRSAKLRIIEKNN